MSPHYDMNASTSEYEPSPKADETDELQESSEFLASEEIEGTDKDKGAETLECSETYYLASFNKLVEHIKNDTGDKHTELSDVDLSNMVRP